MRSSVLVYVAILSRGRGEDAKRLEKALSPYGAAEVAELGDGLVFGFAGEKLREGRLVKSVVERGGGVAVVDGYLDDRPLGGVAELAEKDMPVGHYAALEAWGGVIRCIRDHMGCRPLFMGRLRGSGVVVSNLPAVLEALGATCEAIPPAALVETGPDWIKARLLWRPATQHATEDVNALVEKLRRALDNSVRLLVRPKSGLFFSGGLDSTLLAKLCIDQGLEPVLVSAGMAGARDWGNVERAADLLGVEALRVEITERDVERAVTYLERLLGRLGVMDAAIGCVLALQAERLGELGVGYAVAGQGADELFGGYMKYVRLLDALGDYHAVGLEMWRDATGLHRLGLPRDVVSCWSHGVELLLPYLLPGVAELGLGIPPELKLRKLDSNVVRKYILRLVAEGVGLKSVAYVEKSAMQYGTRVNRVVERLMRRWGRMV